MFLPRFQTKLLALAIIVGLLYLLTTQGVTPRTPATFSYPFSHHNATSDPSPPLVPATPSGDEKEATEPESKPQPLSPPKAPNTPVQQDSRPKESNEAKGSQTAVPSTKIQAPQYTPLPIEPGIPKATSRPDTTKAAHVMNQTSKANTTEGQIDFWKEFAPLLASAVPDCPPPERLGKAEAQPFNYKPTERYDVLSMPDDDIAKMKAAHEKFLAGLHGKPAELIYTPGTRGLVTTAGGSYLPVFAVSLRMLRRTGTTLPMEVFLADQKEYESYICDHVFPKLNARCVVLSDILDAAPHAVSISHYQYKVFAMIFSSFEEVLFLDSDAFALHDSDQLFTSEPFTNHGLVTWPDYWASSASPMYYKIAGQPVPPLSIRQSTESGELLLNKNTHTKSLLLATYYNYYGSHYYTLFSQGAAGEGDKETFIAAAYALNETFYQVAEPVKAIGHATSKGWHGSAMVQYDPMEDYNLTQHDIWHNRDKDAGGASPPRPFFLHVNVPRLNPAKVFDHEEHTTNIKGEPQHLWQGDTIHALFGGDVEKQVWEEVKWVSCELENKFETWKDVKGLCDKATKYLQGAFGSSGEQSKEPEKPLAKPAQEASKTKEEAPHPFGASSEKST
ncbi:MAG: hypothetical protein Q9191_002989 [Dirinaria sp. TL-2023a]